jgi:streptomycin 6-kinase
VLTQNLIVSLPPEFIQTIKNTFGTDGEAWLDALPNLISEASRRWGLTDIQPVCNLSYNFVAFARRLPSPSGSPKGMLREGNGGEGEVVLKLGVPNHELTSEIAALRLYDGHGTCRLLDADESKGMLLLEPLQPGHMLTTLTDDERATQIAAEVMCQLWRPVPEKVDDFIQLKSWFKGFKRLRKRHDGKTRVLLKHLVETAESLSRDLLSENKDETLLHGDFHHYNVLQSARGWLAIDPKGVVGPRGYEVGPLLINPIHRFLKGSNPQAQTAKRIAILSEMLGMERERIRAWGICHALLSAWWSVEDGGDWEYAIRCAEIFLTI